MQSPKRAIALRLNREALDLLQSAPAKIVFDVSQDNGTSLVIGGKRFAVNYQPIQNLPHQVYRGASANGSPTTTPVELLANVVQAGTLKQVLSKEEKTRMRHLTEQAEREKNARRTELIPTVPIGSSPRSKTSTPTRQRVLSPSSVRASPSRVSATNKSAAGTSPIPISASSATTPSSTSARLDPAFIQSVRERLIHLLAIYPHPFSQLTTKLKIRETDLMPILKKVAVESKGNWCLRPEVYKELRIWEWKRYDDKERNTVIKNAEDAYDALKLPRNAPERLNLVQQLQLQRKKASPQTLLAPPPQRTPSNDPVTTPSTTSSSSSKGTASSNTNAAADARSPAKRPAPSTGTTTKIDDKRSKTESKGKVKAIARKSPQKPPNQKQRPHLQPTTTATKPTPSLSTNSHSTNSIPTSTITTTTSSTATHNNTIAHKEPPHHPSKGRKQPQTTVVGATTATTTTTKMARTDSDSPATMTTSSSASGSSDNEDEDEEIYEPIVVSPITTQAQFIAMCKDHDEAQQEYIRLKHKISKDHPLYMSALDQVDEPSNVKDEEQRRDIYYNRVKTAYTSHGGTEWRTIVQLTRQFNHQLNKVNALWDEVERAYQKHQFSLPSSRR